LGLKNLLKGERRSLYAGLAVIGALFWGGLFVLLVFLLNRFWNVELVGPLLARTLLQMMLVFLFVMLSFSNVITALSTYYLAEDLELVLGLPVARPVFHYARLLDTLAQSSWMMLLFGGPVFFAYGIAAEASWVYFLSVVVVTPALMLISVNIGTIIATILVNIFPARRTRELMVLLGLMMVSVLFVVMRTLRPERLLETQEFESLVLWLADVQVPAPTLFPARWASDILLATLLGTPIPWLPVALLCTGTLAFMALGRWTTAWGFDNGWVRSQEARAARFYKSPLFDWIAGLFPQSWQAVVAKELRIFVRDPSQWSQIFMLLGLCGVYLISAWSLPLDGFTVNIRRWVTETLVFLNLGMGGFVMSAIAARFQFTAVSREGRGWWIVRSAPIEPVRWLWAKSMVGLVPMVVVGEVVVVGSGILLRGSSWLVASEAVSTLFLAFALSGMATGMGALWPDFKADTAARAAQSPAAVFYMVIAMAFTVLILGLQVLGFMMTWQSGLAKTLQPVPFVVALLACLWAGSWPIRKGAMVLWDRGL
jgi:ABC-2 type transport system permease protein